MRIPSGTTDQYVYFVAVDATDFTTRETGLASFTVYRSRNGGAAAAFTTPTINEVDATNMPGVYELLVDEDTTIGAGNTEEELVLHITHAGMAPVTRAITLFRPVVTEGETLTVGSGIAAADVQEIDGDANAALLLMRQVSQAITGTAQAGAASTITLAASGPSATDDFYNSGVVFIVSGTGAGQSRVVSDYVGGTKVATVSPPWGTAPDATSVYLLVYQPPAAEVAGLYPRVDVREIAGATVNAALAQLGVNIVEVGGVAADLPTGAEVAAIDGNVDTILTRQTDHMGATFSTATDSNEALRNRGDAAWITGGGGTNPAVLQSTTIAALTSQTVFTLTAGSADNDAYNGMLLVVTDQSTTTQKAVGTVLDYVGSTKQITLEDDPGVFTMAVGDTVDIIAVGAAASVSVSAIADAVWDEATSGHTTAGTFGERVTRIPNAAAGGTGGLPTVDASNNVAGVQALSATVMAAIADAILGRNLAGGSDGGRDVTSALRVLRNKSTTSGGTFYVYAEDDSTVAWSATITTGQGDPITNFDPS